MSSSSPSAGESAKGAENKEDAKEQVGRINRGTCRQVHGHCAGGYIVPRLYELPRCLKCNLLSWPKIKAEFRYWVRARGG